METLFKQKSKNNALKQVEYLKSNIAWTDYTVNFWMGCDEHSTGCKNCYMTRILEKQGKDPKKVTRTSERYWNNIKLLKYEKEPQLIFTCSMSDFFHKKADPWRNDAWKIIKELNHHHWLILTKRSDRIAECLPADWGDEGYPNVWLGVSVGHASELCKRSVKYISKKSSKN